MKNLSKFLSMFTFILVLSLITFLYSCNDNVDNLPTSQNKQNLDVSSMPESCILNYTGSCYWEHHCLSISESCPKPPFATIGYVTVDGHDCNGQYFYCRYMTANGSQTGLGNFIPDGTYTITMVFYNSNNTTNWVGRKVITFVHGQSYNGEFCLNECAGQYLNNYGGSCFYDHRVLTVEGSHFLPPLGTPGHVMIDGHDCNNQYYFDYYDVNYCNSLSLGDFFPDGTYTISIFFGEENGSNWSKVRTITFAHGVPYDDSFHLILIK
ncbi:MAG: hypothetical protein PHN88_01445 [Ignavibacteria bacterium]|nr:hypothetical protein [Ignavibacteria bacterium]